MSSVIVELQREALDRNVHVSDLLRKALVVARNLALTEFQRWIELELNGYDKAEGFVSSIGTGGASEAWRSFGAGVINLKAPAVCQAGRQTMTFRPACLPSQPRSCIRILVGAHIRSQNRVDASLVSPALLAKPLEDIGVDTYGHGFLRPGHNDFGGVPKDFVRWMSVWIGFDAVTDLFVRQGVERIPIRLRLRDGRSTLFAHVFQPSTPR